MHLALALLATRAHALDLEGPNGLKQGQSATFLVSGGTAGQTVGLVYGGAAPGPCPGVLGGLCLDVSAPVVAATAVVRADGTAVLRVNVPPAAPLVDVRLQAAEIGGSPSVSPVLVLPVLTRLQFHLVVDAATLATAQRAWEVDGTLELRAGPYPAVVSLPHLERADTVMVSGASRDLSLPALVGVDHLVVDDTPGARVTAPALFGPDDSLAGAAFEVGANVGPVTITAPAVVQLGSVSILSNLSSVAVDAPLANTISAVGVSASSGDLSQVLPTQTYVASVNVQGHLGPILDLLPQLTSVESVFVLDNPGLQTLGLGAPGLSVTGQLEVSGNPALSDVSGFDPASNTMGRSPLCYDNPSLASCACADLMTAYSFPLGLYCYGNAPDTCSDEPSDLCY